MSRYRNKEESAYTATEADVVAALEEPLVAEFGYSSLFRSWLDARRGGRGPGLTHHAFLDPITKQGSRCFLYWGV